jgi:hypothetical protein
LISIGPPLCLPSVNSPSFRLQVSLLPLASQDLVAQIKCCDACYPLVER